MANDPPAPSPADGPAAGAWAEVVGTGPLGATRRDLLKAAGFSLAALALPGCQRGRETEALPLADRPPELTPGRALWYATLCQGCEAGCGLLVKCRDGRPIKVEGNPEHPLSRGSTCAIGQAQVLALYDAQRLATPVYENQAVSWDFADARIAERLAAERAAGRKVRVLTGTVNGPTRRRAIARFLDAFPGARQVRYDPVGRTAALDAHEELFGVRHLPRVRLATARLVVAVEDDFLGAGVSPVEHARDRAAARSLAGPDAPFARHVQVEARLSLTGAAADARLVRAPWELPGAVAALAEAVGRARGVPVPWAGAPSPGPGADAALDALGAELAGAAPGTAVVLCGLDDPFAQRAAAWLNHQLGAYGPLLDLAAPSFQRLGDDRALATLRRELEAGEVGALLVAGGNPLYDLPDAEGWEAAFARAGLVVSFATLLDETSTRAHFTCPDTHPFERWDDAEPVAGLVTLGQPLLTSLGRGRPFVESLARWAGAPATDREQVQAAWREEVHPAAETTLGFEAFFAQAVHDGFARLARPLAGRGAAPGAAPRPGVPAERPAPAAPEAGAFALVLHASLGVLDGRHAHNPWLQELPDPLTKVSWDNVAALAPAAAKALGVKKGDWVRLEAPGAEPIELPVVIQPGQHERAIAVGLGYGRLGTDRFEAIGPRWIQGEPTVARGGTVGARASGFLEGSGGGRTGPARAVRLTPVAARHALATSQLYDSLTVPAPLAPARDRHRPFVQEARHDAWRRDPAAGRHGPHPEAQLWDDDHAYTGHHWAMAIDLTQCTGCSACVVACQAENNVPVVGRDEMHRQRSMHWLRVDRYFEGDGEAVRTAHQPMLCQHCDHAPCETVCPVLATVHSKEGLNQQVYNRCVGTRYCSNNCPYKVRRFNWFEYARDDEVENLVLNPDVTVRTRGVMEKCSFCVQRIEEARQQARREGRPLRDGDVTPACAQVCPVDAVVFGDRNDAASRVAARRSDPRHYLVLGELNVRPSVGYLTKVRRTAADGGGARHE